MADAAEAVRLLRNLRQPDGGYAPSPGADAEPEATAIAAIALDDMDARRWLVNNQRGDGGFLVGPESIRNDSATGLAALALDGDHRERAIDYLVAHQAQPLAFDARYPHDPATRGWGWTSTTFAWTEPTARAVLTLKLLRPAADELTDGIAVLRDRECAGGGWNYGNREVLGRTLEPFLQTSAAGLMAVHDGPADMRERAASVVERLWPDEEGALGWAMSLVALQLVGASSRRLRDGLQALIAESTVLADGVALGWTVLALDDAWTKLRVAA